jgi:hypothetical protein
MKTQSTRWAALVAAAACLSGQAYAHGIAGARIFPTTLTIDDPAVSDEASLPTITSIRHGSDNGSPVTHETDIGFEYDKRITDQLGIAINRTWIHLDQVGAKSLDGWNNWQTTLKYQFLQNAPHELLMSAGVIGEWGGSGADRVGADRYGSVTPTLYFGKGFGDLPDGMNFFKPIAVTGTLGYQFSNQRTRTTTVVDPDSGIASLSVDHRPDVLAWGLSLQYSLPYLQSQVKDIGLPAWLGRVTPLVELAFTTPTTAGFGQKTQGTISPGFLYDATSYQIGIEAVIPANHASGSNVGVIAQLHFFLDDIFPSSLGKPLFGL